jgi:hypothetical protein
MSKLSHSKVEKNNIANPFANTIGTIKVSLSKVMSFYLLTHIVNLGLEE